MSKVTFDYSKAAPFIKDHEVESMKKLGNICGIEIGAAVAGTEKTEE